MVRFLIVDASEVAGGFDPARHPIDPTAAVRSGFDATALLVLWLLRSAAPALFFAGLAYAWAVGESRFESIAEVTSPGQAVRLLLSPFVFVAVAIILRFLVGIAALVLAYPLSRRETGSSIGPGMPRRPFRVWADRLHLVRAYRSLRWTSSVQAIRSEQARPAGSCPGLVGSDTPGRRHPHDRSSDHRRLSQPTVLTTPHTHWRDESGTGLVIGGAP